MSELKAITVYDAYWKANCVGEGTGVLVYLKSEADHYISELIADQQLELDDWYCKVQHHKYKRCLAMARWCSAEADVADVGENYEDMRWFQMLWFQKWQKRWLELAEKFKEAK